MEIRHKKQNHIKYRVRREKNRSHGFGRSRPRIPTKREKALFISSITQCLYESNFKGMKKIFERNKEIARFCKTRVMRAIEKECLTRRHTQTYMDGEWISAMLEMAAEIEQFIRPRFLRAIRTLSFISEEDRKITQLAMHGIYCASIAPTQYRELGGREEDGVAYVVTRKIPIAKITTDLLVERDKIKVSTGCRINGGEETDILRLHKMQVDIAPLTYASYTKYEWVRFMTDDGVLVNFLKPFEKGITFDLDTLIGPIFRLVSLPANQRARIATKVTDYLVKMDEEHGEGTVAVCFTIDGKDWIMALSYGEDTRWLADYFESPYKQVFTIEVRLNREGEVELTTNRVTRTPAL